MAVESAVSSIAVLAVRGVLAGFDAFSVKDAGGAASIFFLFGAVAIGGRYWEGGITEKRIFCEGDGKKRD